MNRRVRRVIAKYAALVRARFPMVELRLGPGCPDDVESLYIDAFCVPDDREEEFDEFTFSELPDLSAEAGFVDVVFMPRTESMTREYYPGVCRHGAQE